MVPTILILVGNMSSCRMHALCSLLILNLLLKLKNSLVHLVLTRFCEIHASSKQILTRQTLFLALFLLEILISVSV